MTTTQTTYAPSRHDLKRAATLLQAMNAQAETSDPWTIESVLDVALSRGLTDMERTYLEEAS
jgi:hypothetical protein